MNERQQLIQSQEQLKQSLNNVYKDLKAYGKAVAKHTGAIYVEKKDDLLSGIEFAKLEREMEADIKSRTKEHKSAMKELFKEQERFEREFRVLQFKQDTKQKISSIYGKLGQIKNDILVKLSPNNIDVKLRNFYEQAEIAGLTVANKGKQLYDNASQKVSDFTTDQIAKYYEHKLIQEEARAERELEAQFNEKLREEERQLKEETKERKSAMKELFKEQERFERELRVLQFKQDTKQKISSTFGKLGQIKNDILVKLSPNNIDVKLRNFYEQAEIAGLTVANKGKQLYDNASQKVSDFTTDQIAKYYEHKLIQEEARAERELEAQFNEKLREEERQLKEETKERKSAMKELFKEQERFERELRVLQFKQDTKQKISSTFGKLGQIKNDILVKLSPNNIDVKLRDFYEQAEIAGLTVANKGKQLYDNASQKVSDFTTDQIAKYYERKEEKTDIKAFKEAQRQAEKLEIEMTKTRIRERKSAMKEAINSQEREMYEARHLENETKKQELMNSLFGTNDNYEEKVSYAR